MIKMTLKWELFNKLLHNLLRQSKYPVLNILQNAGIKSQRA